MTILVQQLRAEIEQLKAENARWRQNYEHLIEQHMPRTGEGCEEGWSRVIEARELQAENAELRPDAERFRWLIEHACTGSIGFGDGWINADEPPAEWRAAIDHLKEQ